MGKIYRDSCTNQPRMVTAMFDGMSAEEFKEIMAKYERSKSQRASPSNIQQVGGDHYKSMPIQPFDFIQKNKLGFGEGCVIKYVCRHRAKNGREDLLKARHFLDLLIEAEYPQPTED